MSITWTASTERHAHTALTDKIQAGWNRVQSEICQRQSPTRTLYNSPTHFLSILPPYPQYFCYIQEKMVISVGRDVSGVTIATCPSVCPSTSQYGINIATTGVRCSFQHHCYVAPCISCLSLLLLVHFHICVCKTRHPQCQASRPMETLFKTAYFVLELTLGLFDVFNSWVYIEWWDRGGKVVNRLC